MFSEGHEKWRTSVRTQIWENRRVESKYITNSSWKISNSTQIDKNILIKFIAMSSPFSVPEKQMLLETFNLNDLANKLKILLQYYLAEKENITIN